MYETYSTKFCTGQLNSKKEKKENARNFSRTAGLTPKEKVSRISEKKKKRKGTKSITVSLVFFDFAHLYVIYKYIINVYSKQGTNTLNFQKAFQCPVFYIRDPLSEYKTAPRHRGIERKNRFLLHANAQ